MDAHPNIFLSLLIAEKTGKVLEYVSNDAFVVDAIHTNLPLLLAYYEMRHEQNS